MFVRKLESKTTEFGSPVLDATPLNQPTPTPVTLGSSLTSSDLGDSVIGQDLTIEGQAITIRCRGTLHINGTIQAELHSKGLTVGESGTVQGTIAAEVVDVFGRVSGTIRGAKVVLRSSSEVEGDIHAGSLQMEEGASFDGRSRRAADAAASHDKELAKA